ncbi:MAG: glycosyltransferase family 2 protein [Fimbriimonas sp.]
MPKVSVLFTCYNHLRFLPEALESVRRQTFTDYEIIALDDGSTDGTREWLSQQSDLKLVFNEKNLGTYATLNVGLKHATGDFIAVLNDDDVWTPKKLESQLALFAAHPQIGLSHTGGYFIDENSKQVHGSPLGFAFPRFATGDVLLGLVYENKIIASASMARREVFEELGGFNESYFGLGDWEMWFRIAEKYHFGFADEVLTLYRVHGENASRQSDKMHKDGQRLREWMIPRIEAMIGRFPADDVLRAQARNYAALGVVRTLNGDPNGGRKAFMEAIRLEPKRLKSYMRYGTTFLPNSVFKRTLRS